MKALAAAFVAVALCAASFAGDAGLVDLASQDNWDNLAGLALLVFVATLMFAGDNS